MIIFNFIILSAGIEIRHLVCQLIVKPWYKLKNKVSKVVDKIYDNNELTFYRAFNYSGGYSDEQRNINESIDKIFYKFRNYGGKKVPTLDSTTDTVLIEAKFNNIYYAFFDLDDNINISVLELFKKIYADTPYVIFISSKIGRYWGILDVPYKNLDDIFLDTNWKVCNDNKYVTYSKQNKTLFMRGLYETEDRKPYLFETNGKLSENFQLFIDKLTRYYNKEGL
jgi:hypothetical protein